MTRTTPANKVSGICAIKAGYQKSLISSEALKISLALESGEKIRVGFSSDKERQIYFEKNQFQKIDRAVGNLFPNREKIDDQGIILNALKKIEVAELEREDLLELIKQALKVDASLGQIVQSLKNLDVRSFR